MIRKILLVLLMLVLASSCAFAQKSKSNKVSFGVTYGAFFPSDSTAKDRFGDTWQTFSLGRFDGIKSNEWKPTFDLMSLRKSGAKLWVVSFGMQKGLTTDTDIHPYVAGRVGPYYADVKYAPDGIDEKKWGLNANAAVGVIFNENFFIEARYDVFSKVADTNFNGLSLNAGIKLFDVNL